MSLKPIDIFVAVAALVLVAVVGANYVAKPALAASKPAPQNARDVLNGLVAIEGLNLAADIELATAGKLSMGAYKGVLSEAVGRCERSANVPIGDACEIARSEFLRANQD